MADVGATLLRRKPIADLPDGHEGDTLMNDGTSRTRSPLNLASIRRRAHLTQAQLGSRLGVNQASISRTERQHDLLYSTLVDYLAGVAGDLPLTISVTVGNITTVLSDGDNGRPSPFHGATSSDGKVL
ncbi:helix-turn-helix transcriptional regulator [Rhodococcus sp. NPDC080181]|uniref:helix-turn-helix transcriptional regulator n=1 Tax=Rhodococcus sp. NPDC080181 TaxID=3155292 RepID=UPI00344B4BF1